MRWKTFVAASVLVLVICAPLRAASLDRSARKSKSAVSNDDVRKAIAIFRRNPLNAQGEMSEPLILSFGKNSPNVEIAVSRKRMPWIDDNSIASDVSATLTVAYMAGDIVAQLDKGTTKDDPLAATDQVIATYRQLLDADAKLKVPSVERLIVLQKQGKLAEYFKGD